MKKIITTIAILVALITGSQAQNKVNNNKGFCYGNYYRRLPKMKVFLWGRAEKLNRLEALLFDVL